MNSLIQLRRYDEGEEAVHYCLELTPEGSFNWLLTYQFYLILLFHAERHQDAYEIYRKVNPLKKAKGVITPVTEETWNIIDAFMYYFISSGRVEIPEGIKRKRFSVGKFMNTVLGSAKDKRGMNIAILVVQLLIWLNQKKYDNVISRTEALQAYSTRHLRKDDTFRSNCFIKMLAQIPIANFSRIALERKTAPLLKKLKSTPLEEANQQSEVEIVPYELLWEFVLESLNPSPPSRWKNKKMIKK